MRGQLASDTICAYKFTCFSVYLCYVLLQMLLESQALYTIETSSFDFAQALIDFGFVKDFRQTQIGSFIRQAATAAELCGSLSDRLDLCNSTIDALAASLDAATRTKCNDSILSDFERCCAVPIVDYRGRGLEGVLPSSFIASPVTVFADNPGLCGLIWQQAQQDTKYVLRNSNVRLSLMDLSAGDQTFVLKLVHGSLGTDVKAYNLQGPIREGDAVKVCALLDTGTVLVMDVLSKACKEIFKAVQHSSDPNCLQSTVLELSFFAAALRVDEYNGFISAYDAGLVCGDHGRIYRARVAAVTWGASIATAVSLCILFLLAPTLLRKIKSRLKSKTGARHEQFRRWLHRLKAAADSVQFLRLPLLLLIFVYDEITDWVFVSEIAAYGNVGGTYTVGWLHFTKNTVTLYYLLCVLLHRYGDYDTIRRCGHHFDGYNKIRLCLVGLVGIMQFISLWVVVGATTGMKKLRLLSTNAFAPQLALEARNMFLITSIPSITSQFVLFMLDEAGGLEGVRNWFVQLAHAVAATLRQVSRCCRQQNDGNQLQSQDSGNDAETPRHAARTTTTTADDNTCILRRIARRFGEVWKNDKYCAIPLIFIELFGESVAQGVAQTVMWTNGSTLAATRTFVQSNVGSAVSIVMTTFSMFRLIVLPCIPWLLAATSNEQVDGNFPMEERAAPKCAGNMAASSPSAADGSSPGARSYNTSEYTPTSSEAELNGQPPAAETVTRAPDVPEMPSSAVRSGRIVGEAGTTDGVTAVSGAGASTSNVPSPGVRVPPSLHVKEQQKPAAAASSSGGGNSGGGNSGGGQSGGSNSGGGNSGGGNSGGGQSGGGNSGGGNSGGGNSGGSQSGGGNRDGGNSGGGQSGVGNSGGGQSGGGNSGGGNSGGGNSGGGNSGGGQSGGGNSGGGNSGGGNSGGGQSGGGQSGGGNSGGGQSGGGNSGGGNSGGGQSGVGNSGGGNSGGGNSGGGKSGGGNSGGGKSGGGKSGGGKSSKANQVHPEPSEQLEGEQQQHKHRSLPPPAAAAPEPRTAEESPGRRPTATSVASPERAMREGARREPSPKKPLSSSNKSLRQAGSPSPPPPT
ncbi:hypothetical protein PLESTF_001873300 [Pleodorina starrii]|nr:hypothetical protein PLESTF_001873300 [Pleodorina starrii]